MNWSKAIRVVFLLFVAGHCNLVLAQGSISIDLVEDRTYIAQGDAVKLTVRISNPIDSVEVVEGIRGNGYGMNLTRDQSDYAQLEINTSCGQALCPVVPGNNFPLLPGEAADFDFGLLKVGSDAIDGMLIRVSDIYLKLFGANQRVMNDVHLKRDFIAVVSADGQGDATYLNNMETTNPYAGSADIEATLSLQYPQSIPAGNDFEITGTLTNQGSEPINGSFILGYHNDVGAHSRSFRQISCLFKCVFNGQFPIKKDDSIDLKFRQVYYDAQQLFTGDFMLVDPYAIVKDKFGRSAYIYADHVFVKVTHTGNEPEPAVYPPIPDREALRLVNSADPVQRAVIYDPNTGKSWIPLPETQGMSFSEVLSETQAGGKFSGYSVASSEEVRTLFLDHIYASGLNYPDFALFVGSHELHGVAGSLLDLFGETLIEDHIGGRTRYARAMVADVPESGSESVSLGIWQQNIDTGLFAMSGSFSQGSFYRSQYEGMGTWLVSSAGRGSHTEAFKAPARNDFRYGELFLASVSVGGNQYKASFRVIDKTSMTLELVSMIDEFTLDPVASFDHDNLILKIPKLEYFVFPDEAVYFDVELKLIPNTNPVQFKVVSAEPVR